MGSGEASGGDANATMSAPQQYCLRWNNHRSNLLTVFDQLLQNEAFTDVTLACEGGTSVKCHKMVLAACSSYFQGLFTELPCRHPVVVLKDVRYTEMKAILEYMYRGEVNVGQDQLAALLKVAEALKVKGLVEEGGAPLKKPDGEEEPNAITSSAAPPSSSVEESPPHSTGGYARLNYPPTKQCEERCGRMPVWGFSGLPMGSPSGTAYSSTGNRYETISADVPPLRRKKLSSLLMASRDTPILRTVLGQGHADSSQPVPLLCRPDTNEQDPASPFTNGSTRSVKQESTSEDTPSPYTDISAVDEEDRNKLSLHSSSPQHMANEIKDGPLSGLSFYMPTQKPEWKRYKQYTRDDIMSAIEAVRNGMSALQASRKFGVPSRTLYDKVKKLGITTSRPFRRSAASNGAAAFPYGSASATAAAVYGHLKEEAGFYAGAVDHGFLQHALEAHGIKREEREALAALGEEGVVSSNERSPAAEVKFPSSPPVDDPDDRVEDLSVSRKPDPSVIMPPLQPPTLAASDLPQEMD